MGGNQYFQFKQFMVIQEKSAMKVGTDGVLLGAWANVSKTKKILDIGTGTGVIALMMAQRTDAEITAIEIERDSCKEARSNFQKSPWGSQLIPIQVSFQNFCIDTAEKFDLIISNPPFFENASKAAEQNRSNARHTDLLPFTDLITGSLQLLTGLGIMSIIIPVEQYQRFILIAESIGLNIIRLTKVKSKPGKPFHRFLIELSKQKREIRTGELTIEEDIHHQFTSEYMNLTKDFYLAF